MIRRLSPFAALGPLLLAAPVWAQSAECSLLTAMQQADAAVAGFAARGGGGGARVSIAGALGDIRSRGVAVTAAGGVAGFDSRFIADFATSRDNAMALLARGAPAHAVLAEPTLNATAGRLAQLYLAFDCATELDRRDAIAAAGNPGNASQVAADRAEGQALPPRVFLDPQGAGRFTRLRDFGGNPWRLQGNPVVWQFMSIFLLAFAVLVTLLNWLRSLHHHRAERFPCCLNVLVFRGARPMRARLSELSHLGAKVKLDRPPQRGARVTLKWRRIRVEARVVWANQYFAGLSFLTRLDDSTCAQLLAAGRPEVSSHIKPEVAA